MIENDARTDMNALRRNRLHVFLLLLVIGLPVTSLSAQPSSPGNVIADASVSLHDAQRAHLYRVLAWGGLNVAVGASLLLLSDRTEQRGRFGFGMQSAAWGTINMGIAVAGLAARGDVDTETLAAALQSENAYSDILLFNLGLNVAYASVGATLLAVSGRGVAHPDAWRGHGTALIVQGAGLFVLDGIAYFGSRTRMATLLDVAELVSIHMSPLGVTLTVQW